MALRLVVVFACAATTRALQTLRDAVDLNLNEGGNAHTCVDSGKFGTRWRHEPDCKKVRAVFPEEVLLRAAFPGTGVGVKVGKLDSMAGVMNLILEKDKGNRGIRVTMGPPAPLSGLASSLATETGIKMKFKDLGLKDVFGHSLAFKELAVSIGRRLKDQRSMFSLDAYYDPARKAGEKMVVSNLNLNAQLNEFELFNGVTFGSRLAGHALRALMWTQSFSFMPQFPIAKAAMLVLTKGFNWGVNEFYPEEILDALTHEHHSFRIKLKLSVGLEDGVMKMYTGTGDSIVTSTSEDGVRHAVRRLDDLLKCAGLGGVHDINYVFGLNKAHQLEHFHELKKFNLKFFMNPSLPGAHPKSDGWGPEVLVKGPIGTQGKGKSLMKTTISNKFRLISPGMAHALRSHFADDSDALDWDMAVKKWDEECAYASAVAEGTDHHLAMIQERLPVFLMQIFGIQKGSSFSRIVDKIGAAIMFTGSSHDSEINGVPQSMRSYNITVGHLKMDVGLLELIKSSPPGVIQ